MGKCLGIYRVSSTGAHHKSWMKVWDGDTKNGQMYVWSRLSSYDGSKLDHQPSNGLPDIQSAISDMMFRDMYKTC